MTAHSEFAFLKNKKGGVVFIQKMFLAAVFTSLLERSSGKTDFNVKVLLHVEFTFMLRMSMLSMDHTKKGKIQTLLLLCTTFQRDCGKKPSFGEKPLHDVTEGTGTSPTVVTTRQVPILPGKTVQVLRKLKTSETLFSGEVR